MATASTSVIKNAKTKSAAASAPASAPVEEVAVEAAAETQSINVETMSGKEIEALVKEHEIATPEGWDKLKLADKKAWLLKQFGGGADAETATDETASATEATETAAAAPAAETAAAPAATAAAPAKGKGGGSKSKTKPAAAVEPTPEPVVEAAAPAPAEPEKKGRGKAASTKKSLPSKGEDKLSDLVNEIEHLTEAKAKEAIRALNEDGDFAVIKLGGVLSRVQKNSWFAPFPNFKDYVEAEFGISARRAIYYVQIYNDLAESGIAWSDVSHIGWTKLKEISSVITKENVKHWVGIAEKQTTIQLHETVVAHKKAKAEGSRNPEEQAHKNVTTKTFKVHDDQKVTINGALEKAKSDSNTEYDTTALEYICQEYMGQIALSARLKAIGVDKALEALTEAFPDIDFSVAMPDVAEETKQAA